MGGLFRRIFGLKRKADKVSSVPGCESAPAAAAKAPLVLGVKTGAAQVASALTGAVLGAGVGAAGRYGMPMSSVPVKGAVSGSSVPPGSNSVYTTVVLEHGIDRAIGFDYEIGGHLHGRNRIRNATRVDTNVVLPGRWFDDHSLTPDDWTGISWMIPVLQCRLGLVGPHSEPAGRVLQADVDAFVSTAVIDFFFGDMDKPCFTLVPGHHPIESRGNGTYQYAGFPDVIRPSSAVRFSVRVSFPGGPLQFSTPDVTLALVVRLCAKSDDMNARRIGTVERARVQFSKGDVEKLVADVLFWKPGEGPERDGGA